MNKYALSGASFPLHISGKEFAAYSLRSKDYDELSAYIQSKVLEVALAAIPSTLLQSERAEWQQAAIRAAASSGWGTSEGIRIMNTVEGYWRLGWQMVRKENTISFEDFVRICLHKDEEVQKKNLEEIDSVFVVLNTDLEEEDADEPEEGSSETSKSG